MVEVGVSIAVKVAEYLVAPIVRPFSYIWNYKTNFQNLEMEVQKLNGRRDTVQHMADEARRNSEEIEEHVNNWLDRVTMMADEVSEVIEENMRADMKCIKGLCPDPKKRYQHSRKAVKKTEAVARLYEEGKFDRISYQTIPKETWITSYKGYMSFESRISTSENIIDALSNPDVNTVGIYGTGGIGKTTLAREVAAHSEKKELFDVVAFAEVAVKPDIKEIQQEIADKLRLTFREESVSGRARSLQQRLKQEEKVLLVLDNIWEKINLEEVGIPFGNEHTGCKVLLTTRSLDVLSEMDSQNNFQIGVLNKAEAWSLFKKKAGACIENNDHLQATAIKVAEACKGLPIAINSVAVALKNKEEFEWKDALRKLTTPSSGNFEGVAAETYSSIEISYSQLKGEELKSTFLLCSIMKYTRLEDLWLYGMGLGIFEDVEAMEDARNRVNTLVRKLKDSSLLLGSYNYRFFLHDVVRDVGRSIASRDKHMFAVTNNCVPREWVDKDALKNCVGISLHNINELPKEFGCPELKFFYMSNSSRDFWRVPDNFFIGMPKLKVLHLVGLELYSLPNSIRLLVNLRTLYIDDCKLRDIDFIGEITQLEILRIRGSYCFEIQMFSKKMCNLTGLRLLDLKDCNGLRNIPPNVLSTLTQLEELYLPNSYWTCVIKWEVEGINILDDLKLLTRLTALEICIPDGTVLPKGFLLSKKLERYKIIIGNGKFYNFHYQESNTVLKLSLSTCRTDDVQKFLSVLDREGFSGLEDLLVEDSPCFRTVVDFLESESCDPFPFLKLLFLERVPNLEKIYNHQIRAGSSRQLRTIKVKMCNKLKNIFSFSTYTALPLLQEIDVSSSDNMEEIFAIRREEDINNNEGPDLIEFKQLRYLTLESLPNLTSFCSIDDNKDTLDTPTPLFSQKVAFPSLEEIKLSKMDHLEMIWPNQLCKDLFCNLKSLEVTDCNNLLTIFQSNNLFQCLKQLKIEKCSNLKVVFSSSTVAFPSLEKIKISKMDNLEMIWPNQLCKDSFCNLESLEVTGCNKLLTIFQSNIFQCLKELKIEKCSNLKVVFSSSTVAFPSLEEIKISHMDDLEMIWPNQLCKDSFCNLKSLEVTRCNKLLTIFQSNMLKIITRLESLTIGYCDLVEEIFDLQIADFEESHSEIKIWLQKLDINGLPKLKHIWNKDPKKMFSFKKLYSVKVHNSRSLKYLLPVSIAENLSELENFSVYNCGVEEIVADDQGEENVAATFVFPRIISLELNYLPRLKTFYRGVHTSQLQNLKKLVMGHCDKVELFASDLFNFQENNDGQHDSSIQPLFIAKKDSFANLEKLILGGEAIKMILKGQFSEQLYCSLEFLEVCNDKSVGFPLCILQRFRHLHQLHLKSSSYKEIFSYEGDKTHVGIHSKLDTVLQKLKSLIVYDCDKLIQLIPSAVSFQNLTYLEVRRCYGLKNLMTSSTAKSLVQLREMVIGECKSMIELVAKEGDATEDKIIFSKLRNLTLGDLLCLTCFCSENYTFELPSLEELNIFSCSKLKTFWSGDVIMPLLQKVKLNGSYYTLEGTHFPVFYPPGTDNFWD